MCSHNVSLFFFHRKNKKKNKKKNPVLSFHANCVHWTGGFAGRTYNFVVIAVSRLESSWRLPGPKSYLMKSYARIQIRNCRSTDHFRDQDIDLVSVSSFKSSVAEVVVKTVDLTKMGRGKTFLRAYADSEGPDQPAHPRSLIRTFTVRL